MLSSVGRWKVYCVPVTNSSDPPAHLIDTAGISRRRFLRTVTFVAGSVLAGCGRDGVPGARVTLKQWYHQYGEAGTQQAVHRYAEAYTRQFPDIAIQVVWVPGDYQTKLNTALLTAGGPDVFEKQLTVPMVSAGQVEPLDDLFPPEIKADFLAEDLALNTVDGRIYGVKMIDDMGLLYFRKSLLEAAGVSPPRTFSELVTVARALTTDTRKGLFLGNDGGVDAPLTLMPWSAGIRLIEGDRIAFDQPRTALAYDRLRELTDSGALLVGAPTDWWDPSAFIQGMCAMQWGGLWAYPAIHLVYGDDLGCAPWPALDEEGQPATFFGGWSQMVNARSPQIEEAKKYARWLWIENETIQRDWAVSYGFHVPPRKSVAGNTSALKDPIPSKAVEILQNDGKYVPPQWSTSMNTALNDAVANIVKRGRPAAPEVAKAARKCQRELDRMLRYRA